MIDNHKIKSSHRQRAAIVYIRQSHPSQMENHPESTAAVRTRRESDCPRLEQESSDQHR
jgi:hypothetical protein